MKKMIYLLLTMFLVPIFVSAETLTYNVCDTCEYTSLNDVSTVISNIADLSDKDIVININGDVNHDLTIDDINEKINSLIINGNNHNFNNINISLYAKKIEIKNCNSIKEIKFYNPEKISIYNSKIKIINDLHLQTNEQIITDEINLSNVIDIDQTSLKKLEILALAGNIKIEKMNFSNTVLVIFLGTINIYDSQISKIYNLPEVGRINTNIYDSVFKTLKYVNINSNEDEAAKEYSKFLDSTDTSVLNYDIYDADATDIEMEMKSTTTIYFNKQSKLKLEDKLNLVDYLDYYTEDKEIEYTIEDESIAKIENKELIGLKEGSTKVTVTTDDGHVVYNISLVVEKETIPEKIDKMTIKVPITGSKIKAWVVVISAILLGVIGVCSYMLIKSKK